MSHVHRADSGAGLLMPSDEEVDLVLEPLYARHKLVGLDYADVREGLQVVVAARDQALARVIAALDEFDALDYRKQKAVSQAEFAKTIRKALDLDEAING